MSESNPAKRKAFAEPGEEAPNGPKKPQLNEAGLDQRVATLHTRYNLLKDAIRGGDRALAKIITKIKQEDISMYDDEELAADLDRFDSLEGENQRREALELAIKTLYNKKLL